jgi:hypothetical protein
VRVRGTRTPGGVDLLAVAVLKDCTFLDNMAINGAGLDVFYKGVGYLENNIFADNNAVSAYNTNHV